MKTEFNSREYLVDKLNTAALSAGNKSISDSAVIGSLMAYGDSLKAAMYAESKDGRHIVDYGEMTKAMEHLIVSAFIFQIRTFGEEKFSDFVDSRIHWADLDDSIDYDIDFALESVVEISKDIGDIILKDKKGLRLKPIIDLMKYNFICKTND
jgi:hypothetical protein